MFRELGKLAQLASQAKEIGARMNAAKEKLGSIRVEGTAGGEMVRVEASGDLRITAVRIDPSLVQSDDPEMFEELLISACNQALQKAKEAAAASMSEVTGGLDIPGLDDMMSKFGGAG